MSTSETDCLKCHLEYDANGKGTHYYYWKHDPPHKKRPPKMEAFYCISISSKKEVETNYVVFKWENNNAPYGYPEFGEYIVDITLLSSVGDSIFLGMERINRKVDSGKQMKAVFHGDIPGVAGYCNDAVSQPLHRKFPINDVKDLKGWKVLVTLKVKAQCWSADAESWVLESRVYEL